MLWNSASKPWYAVNLGGTLSMSSGSTTAIRAKLLGEPMPIFSCVSSLDTTPMASTSDPVPAVVVMATHGSSGRSSGRCRPVLPVA